MIYASAAPGTNPHRHGGHLYNTGAACVSPTRMLALEQRHTMQRHTSINEILSAHMVECHKYLISLSYDLVCQLFSSEMAYWDQTGLSVCVVQIVNPCLQGKNIFSSAV